MHGKVNSQADKIFIDEFAGMVCRAAGKYKGREECNSMTFAAVPLWQNMDSGRDIRKWKSGGTVMANENCDENHIGPIFSKITGIRNHNAVSWLLWQRRFMEVI